MTRGGSQITWGQLDRYLDRLKGQTGLKANRGMIAHLRLCRVPHDVEKNIGALLNPEVGPGVAKVAILAK
jgi:hypothetical protein